MKNSEPKNLFGYSGNSEELDEFHEEGSLFDQSNRGFAN